ncbi:unnamed protein product, partial [marine sediment metagenome]
TYDVGVSEYLYDIKLSSSGDIYLAGREYFSGTTYMDVYLIKFNYELSEFVIISPEDKAYTEPMSGYYPATYGFENDDIGSDPKGWVIDKENPIAEVISELDGHNIHFDQALDIHLLYVQNQSEYGTMCLLMALALH